MAHWESAKELDAGIAILLEAIEAVHRLDSMNKEGGLANPRRRRIRRQLLRTMIVGAMVEAGQAQRRGADVFQELYDIGQYRKEYRYDRKRPE